jgi:putative aldouronate transport system substrate-binding protein
MKSKRLMAAILTAALSVTMLSACKETEKPTDNKTKPGTFDISNAKTIKPKVLGKIQTGNRKPADDKLTPIWREKTKVEPEIVTMTAGQNASQYFQMQKVGGTMPEIIAPTNGVFDNPEIYNLLKQQNIVREITLEDIKNYMPLIQKRLENLGITVEEWYNANVDSTDKKLWYIPGMPNLATTKYRNEEFVKLDNSYQPYNWFFRDDILKQIFPDAKTEKELRELFVKKQGDLTFEDVNDVPIMNLDDLFNYLKKVKELNVKVGNNSVIPAQLQLTNEAGSLMWSAFSLPGFFWQLGDRQHTDTSFSYFAANPEWKEYIRFLNKCYNEGLLGKETFIQKDDQRDSKVINGEYAVFQGWLPSPNARKKAADENRNYGFRKVSLFLDGKVANKYSDTSTKIVGIGSRWGAVGITTSAKDADIPQLLNWIDWNLSDEAAVLRAWGPKEFYTGEGKDRRFKPEYKDIEIWALTGKTGDKDGIYYGMYPSGGSDVDWNHETYGIGSNWRLPYVPQRAYPKELTDPSKVDIDWAYDRAVKLFYYPKFKFFKEKPLGEDVIEARSEFEKIEAEFTKLKKTASYDADGAKTATVQAIVGKPEEFDKKYAEYEKYLTTEFMDNIKKQGEAYIKYWQLYKEKYAEPLQ